MQCFTYARVSTDKQAQKELSIPAQLQAMRQYANDRGWTILEEFVEAGVSARTANRPALRQLLQRCRAREQKVDVVLVHKIDRLARNLADHVGVRAQLRNQNISLASVTESLEDSVSGHLVENILASMAEFYSANLSEEVKKGMKQKVLQGGWPHKPPRGYRIIRSTEEGKIAIDDVDGPLIRQAFDWCLREYRGIAKLRLALASAGLRAKSGHPLSNSQLVRLLTNPFYCGQLLWKGDRYPGSQPLLVSVSTFEQVQRILKDRSRRVVRRPTKFLLTGLASCASCGLKMGGEEHGRWRYYRCRGSFKTSNRCRAPYCNLDRVHQSLAQLLEKSILRPDCRRQLLRAFSDRDLERRHCWEMESRSIDRHKAELLARERHLTTAFAEGALSADAYRDALASLSESRRGLSQRPRASGKHLRQLQQLIAKARSAFELFAIFSQDEQRLLVEVLFERLGIDKSGVVEYQLRDSAAVA